MAADRFFISSLVSSKGRIGDAVTELIEKGFSNIELGGGTEFYETIEDDILRLKEKNKAGFLVHNYFPVPKDNFVMNIAARDNEIRNSTFSLIKKAIDLTKKLGNDLYTIHPGYNKSSVIEGRGRFYDKGGVNDRENAKEDFYKGVDFLLENISQRDLRIGVENLYPFSKDFYSFLDTEADIAEFLDRYESEDSIGFLLDLGHLNVASKALGFSAPEAADRIIAGYSSRIFEIHISENNGEKDFHYLTDLDSWQVRFARKHRNVLKNAFFVFEWRDTADNDTFRHFEKLRNRIEN